MVKLITFTILVDNALGADSHGQDEVPSFEDRIVPYAEHLQRIALSQIENFSDSA